MKRVVAWILKYKKILISRTRHELSVCTTKALSPTDLDVSLLEYAQQEVIRLHQQQVFSEEIDHLKDGNTGDRKSLSRRSGIYNLDSYIDEKHLLRVGGRLKRSSLHLNDVHPVLLGKDCNIPRLIVESCHKVGGRGLTINEIRSNGFWVVQCNTIVRSLIEKCVKCRLLRGKLGEQKMADLPNDRTLDGPPFTNCGVDIFGPFLIKEVRKELKRYGALFTCLASRTVHIECTCSVDTDSFIQALQRFIARRGNIRVLCSENGSNFVVAQKELGNAFDEMDHRKIQYFLQNIGADYIIWHRNPPASSQMGGVWERQIRSARTIPLSLLNTHGRSLNDESLRTLLAETEAILNSRPLTVDTLGDIQSEQPLCLSNILTMKSRVVLPPPGEFVKADEFSRR